MVPEPVTVFSDTVYIGAQTPEGIFQCGTLTYLIRSNGQHIYQWDIDPDLHDIMLQKAGKSMIPSFDPDYGWTQRHDKEIQFIYERCFHPSHEQLEEMLAPWGMSKKDYTKWNFLKRSRGAYHDKLRVTSEISELANPPLSPPSDRPC